MSRKILLILVCFSLVFSFSAVTSAESNVAEEITILEVGGTDSLQGFGGSEVLELIKDSDVLFYEFTGIVSINNQDITFGTSNRDKLSISGFTDQINLLIIDLIKEYTDVTNVSDEQFKLVKSSLKIKSLMFQDSEKKISDFENGKFNKLKNLKNTKIVNYKKKDRETFFAEARKKHDEEKKQKVDSELKIMPVPYNFTQDELKEYKEKANEKIKLKEQGIIKDEAPKLQNSKKLKNLVTIASTICDPSSLNPNCGDQEDRLKQKTRFNDMNWPPVYSWIPTWVGASTFQVDNNTKKRGLNVRFNWDQSSLDNLRRDSNEAIEAEVLFYNYGPGTGVPAYGYAYMYNEPYSGDWSTNLPGGYKDTRFMDMPEEISYTVGTKYVNLLQANTAYEFIYYAYPYPNWKDYTDVGLWQVNFQRGYWLDSTNWSYRQVRGTGDEWYIFNEEKETTAKIKQYHKYNSRLYAPSAFNEYSKIDYHGQFRYKEAFNSVFNGSNVDSGYIPEQGYKVYKLTVDSPNQYKINTSYNAGGPNSDTYLTLYNHDFEEVVSNDDSNGTLYSEINRYLPVGDYYIVLRGYSWSAIQSNLSVSIQSSIGNEQISKGETKYIDIPAGGSKSFSYSASSTGYSTFKTGYWQTSADTYLYLYDSSNTLISSNDDSNNTLYSTISHYMSSGQTFRIEVKGYNGSAVKCTLWVE